MKTILLSTSSLWNCGDDFIRKGLLNAMQLKPDVRMLWWNRGFGIRNAFANNLSINLRSADYVCIAGTPEWIAKTEKIYRYCLKYRIPLSIIGVGTRGGLHTLAQRKLMEKVAKSGLVEVCTARDKKALNLMKEFGFENPEPMLDPAFFMDAIPGEKVNNILCWRDLSIAYSTLWKKKTPRRIAEAFYSNWKIKPKRYNQFMKDVFSLMPEPKLVTVHDNREIKKAEQLFGSDRVFYSVDYMDMLKKYSTAKSYIGSRIHGAIAAAINGASIHLIYANKKAAVIENSLELLRQYIPNINRKIKIDYLLRNKNIKPSVISEDIPVIPKLRETLKSEKESIRAKLKATTHLSNFME